MTSQVGWPRDHYPRLALRQAVEAKLDRVHALLREVLGHRVEASPPDASDLEALSLSPDLL